MSFNLNFFLTCEWRCLQLTLLQQQHYVVMIGRWHCNQEYTLYIGIAFTWKPNIFYNMIHALEDSGLLGCEAMSLGCVPWCARPPAAFQKTWTTLTTTTRISHLMLSILSGDYCLMHRAARWRSGDRQLSKWRYITHCTPHTVMSSRVVSVMSLKVKCSSVRRLHGQNPLTTTSSCGKSPIWRWDRSSCFADLLPDDLHTIAQQMISTSY
jgi:hypothetical protein